MSPIQGTYLEKSFRLDWPRDVQTGSVLSDLNLRYQVLISVLPVSEQAYQNLTGIFWNNIRQEGVLLG